MKRLEARDPNFRDGTTTDDHSRKHIRAARDNKNNNHKDKEKPGEVGEMNQTELQQQLEQLDRDIRENRPGGVRWIPPKLIKELPGQPINPILLDEARRGKKGRKQGIFQQLQPPKPAPPDFSVFRVSRLNQKPMAWEKEWSEWTSQHPPKSNGYGPKVDYTQHKYQYPDIEDRPPDDYPKLETMGELMKRWPQDDLDNPPSPFVERLMHFNFTDPAELLMAKRFRDAELPFKLYDVPDLVSAHAKWTEEYVTDQFDRVHFFSSGVRANGHVEESANNFFAFFNSWGWQIGRMGPPPTRINDWNYAKWSAHARYADATSLRFDQPHFYWQSGVPKEERYQPERSWSFISRDLPSFSSKTETFFVFHPDQQKGIQCRFGERGVTAATHYDAGRNMVGMIHGAKRYILSPPRECSKLGIVTVRGNTIFRHSLLNFGHIRHLHENTTAGMSDEERAWLERAERSSAVETVLKSGEVLYIPSHWFHYITSLQKSAQCNVRAGVNEVGTRRFGGGQDVYDCKD